LSWRSDLAERFLIRPWRYIVREHGDELFTWKSDTINYINEHLGFSLLLIVMFIYFMID